VPAKPAQFDKPEEPRLWLRTVNTEDMPKQQAWLKRECDLFHSKWGDFLMAGDPYYSPHFRLDRHDYALKAA
jgi:hypothetical protein